MVGLMRVVIFTDETGWHTTKLKRALRARGASGHCVDLADCHFDTTVPATQGIVIPGFRAALPDAAIVRGIASGSFEQVTKRLGILHALRECSVPVYNDARGIERSVDKSMTSFLLRKAGVPTPPAWAGESGAIAQRLVMREGAAGRARVLKPLFGSQGKDLLRVGAVDGEHVAVPALNGAYGDVAYLQRYVAQLATPGFDWRVLVVGGRALAAMRRVSRHWIHNVARGASCMRAELTPTLASLAERAAAALDLDYAGVDLMPTEAGATVIEVNGVAAWRGLQRVADFDIAQALVDDLLERRMRGARATPVRLA
jgi:RimK family alpha-L-glutamate ligase